MTRLSSSVIGLLSLVILAQMCDGAKADRRVALVLGNSRYQSINALKNPGNDAPDIAEALRKIGFDVILRTDLDKGNFDRALSEFARKATGADAALFYYAGHGIQYQKQNYLLPTDIEVADYNDVEFQAVSMSRVLAALHRSDGVKILMLDACRDNPLDKQIAASTRTFASARGLARLNRTEGLVIAYATAPDQVAQDGNGRNSPFTGALIRRLAEPGLEIGTLFRRVTQDVYEGTGGHQRPEVSISLLADYYLNDKESDATTWSRIRESDDATAFEQFIHDYPNSSYRRDAQYRLDLFARIRRENEDRLLRQQEQEAAVRDRARREAVDKEREELAAQRAEIARLQAQAREYERVEAERRAAAQAAEKTARDEQARERLRRDVERVAEQRRHQADELKAKQALADRLDREQAERQRAADQQDADRREVERLAALRRAQFEAQHAEVATTPLQGVAAGSEVPREADRREVERRAALSRIERVMAAAPAQSGPEAPIGASDGTIDAKLAKAQDNAEEEQAVADQRELARLLQARKTAIGQEAQQIGAAIDELDRREVARLAARHRRSGGN